MERTMPVFITRMLRAALLHVDTYEEVEADTGANLQALAVVVLAAVAMGIGSIENSGTAGILWHTLVAVAGWYVWAYVTYFVGTRILPTSETVADHGELLRTIGFSSSPGILRVLMIFPPLSIWIFGICSIWMLVAMIVAVRQALDYSSTGRAIAVCAIGFPIYVLSILLSVIVLGPWPG
jgi:hypothetical protein